MLVAGETFFLKFSPRNWALNESPLLRSRPLWFTQASFRP